MPASQVMHEFKRGSLKSGSGKKVTSRKQAIAIMLSEKRKEQGKDDDKKNKRTRGAQAEAIMGKRRY